MAERVPGVEIVTSPVIEIVGTGVAVDLPPEAGVILTSQNAVVFAPDLAGRDVYCVGKKTAARAGGTVRLVAQDADDLVARLDVPGPLVHLRGRHARGNIAERLARRGIAVSEVVVYDQRETPLRTEAVQVIEGVRPVVLPLWSPRSADIVARSLSRVGTNVHPIALSEAVAEAWIDRIGSTPEVCDNPDGDEMVARIVAALLGELA
ncbi:uroporphyrinogen-III synthase [uncultured Maritimibacter sp.]|uniref:uroporphyrinogen-III synthase n=1 Tax=uncultured Maritimibacter sp. TaxID=991866 RepID=UPI00261562F2|nr:uroporphyrinogen-III synthase [uncultured Maritimibacter sp.]